MKENDFLGLVTLAILIGLIMPTVGWLIQISAQPGTLNLPEGLPIAEWSLVDPNLKETGTSLIKAGIVLLLFGFISAIYRYRSRQNNKIPSYTNC